MFFSLLLFALTIVVYRLITGKRSENVRLLLGKTAIVTGGNEGIGYNIVLLLASRGCKVIIADIADTTETIEKIKKLTNNNEIYSEHLDLSSFESTRNFAKRIEKSGSKIDILVNNAGVNPIDKYKTADGLSSTMQINYLGSFLLTHCLLESLKKSDGARIIFTGSILVFPNNLSVDNLANSRLDYNNSKLCNVLAAQEFGKKLKKFNITANAVDPGCVKTRIFNIKKNYFIYNAAVALMLFLLGQDPRIGAQTAFHVAASEEMEGKTAGYYFLCKPWIKPRKVRNQNFCDQIWKKSEEIVKLSPEEKI